MSDFIDQELLKDWFEEAWSQVDEIENNLLVLEKKASDADAIDALFRAAHTLKGGSATVQMDEISTFTHTLEDAMDEVRSGKVQINSEMVDMLLSALDIIKNMITARSNGEIYKKDVSNIKDKLQKIAEGNNTVTSKTPAEKKAEVQPQTEENNLSQTISEYELLELQEANQENLPMYQVSVKFDANNPMRTVGGIQVFTALRDIGTVLKTYPDFDELYSEDFHEEVIYIIATNTSLEKIKKYATISDATVSQKITPFDETSKSELPVTKQLEEKDIDKLAASITQDAISNVSDAPYKPTIETNTFQEAKKIVNDTSEQKSTTSKVVEQTQIKTSSILRVDSARIDDLLNLVSEIVINKATFNQVNSKLLEGLESFGFALLNYKDKIKLFSDKLPQIAEAFSKGEKTLPQIKKDFLKEFEGIGNQFDAFTSKYKQSIERFKSTTQNLDRISADLREGVMRVRMIQIKQIFSRFPRLVRSLSRELGKDIELVLEGEDTEVDKAMLDDLIDPLIHIVRNAIDHAFELPEEREKLGKRNPGKLQLKALNEGNLISIYIIDDGKGIDSDKVRQTAISRGVISSDKVLTEQDTYNLLFEAGFSTADKITSVSGRGVGLDVVKKNIEKLSGTIRITSNKGKGTTFAIKLPLTLAIIQGLMVKVQEEIYSIPISSVSESIRITPDEIKSIDNYEVINVRNDVLSLLRLSDLFNLEKTKETEYYFVVIVNAGEKKLGLLVDTLIGEEDIVIKPLKDKYTNTPGIAGATVLGDGTVSLILDVSQIIDLGLKKGLQHQASKYRGK